jgi:hypothetical protein
MVMVFTCKVVAGKGAFARTRPFESMEEAKSFAASMVRRGFEVSVKDNHSQRKWAVSPGGFVEIGGLVAGVQ